MIIIVKKKEWYNVVIWDVNLGLIYLAMIINSIVIEIDEDKFWISYDF